MNECHNRLSSVGLYAFAVVNDSRFFSAAPFFFSFLVRPLCLLTNPTAAKRWKVDQLPNSFHPFFFSSRRCLPHSLNIVLTKLPLNARIRHLPRQTRLRHLLNKTQTPDRTLPIRDIFSLKIDDSHTRIFIGAIVDAIAKITEPGCGSFGVEVLDARVVVGGGDDGAGDGDPVLRRGVLEGELGGWVVGEVGEFGGVFVGEEEEVGTFALEVGRIVLALNSDFLFS